MSSTLTIPTTTISAPYIGPGLPQKSSIADVVSGSAGGNGHLLTADSNPDELSSLMPLGLKVSSNEPGIQFPGLIMREEQTKSLAIHMYPNLDSARIENTGRNPAHFRIRAILTNNIYPGQNETWTPGLLFPNTFIAIYDILLNNNNIVFQHPILNDITVQVHSWSYELNPKQARDGVFMDIELIETIGDNNPLSQQLMAPPGSGIQQAANALDTAIASAPGQLGLPNMSLTQFFSQITGLISQVTSLPNSVVNSLNAPIIQGIQGASSVAGALIGAPASIVQNTRTAIQQTKNSVLNSPIQQAILNNQATFNNFTPSSLTNAPTASFNSSFSLPSTNYDASTYQAMQSIQALNNTPSQNAFQLLDKTMGALIDLEQHYINQNNSFCSPIITAIRDLVVQLQQQQSALSLNTNQQSVQVATYITKTNMSWLQISSYLNNPIDDLIGLNQGLLYELFVPANTPVSYFQA